MPTTHTSNSDYKKEQALIKRINTEQNFAQQVYVLFREVKYGISPCCYSDFESAVLKKSLCDWQNAASNKVVASTEIEGQFVEPLAQINLKASIPCPVTPTNVVTIYDLEDLLEDGGTYTQCFEVASDEWIITHGLGSYPSVTVVDSANTTVVGNVEHISTQQLKITFNASFSGCAFLN
jgi:hypothetical protein